MILPKALRMLCLDCHPCIPDVPTTTEKSQTFLSFFKVFQCSKLAQKLGGEGAGGKGLPHIPRLFIGKVQSKVVKSVVNYIRDTSGLAPGFNKLQISQLLSGLMWVSHGNVDTPLPSPKNLPGTSTILPRLKLRRQKMFYIIGAIFQLCQIFGLFADPLAK